MDPSPMDLSGYNQEFDELTNDYKKLEEVNREYLELLDNLEILQGKCTASIKHQRYRMNQIWGNVKK